MLCLQAGLTGCFWLRSLPLGAFFPALHMVVATSLLPSIFFFSLKEME